MPARKCDLLVADDHKGVRRLLYEIFCKEGYNVELAGDGRETVEKVQKCRPLVVLLDVKMPDLDGLEILKKIRRRNSTAEVVLMTAYGEMDIISKAREMGAGHYISKPFSIDEIRLLVKTLLAAAESKIMNQCLESG